MVQIHLANVTQQRQVFFYRFDFNTQGDARVRASAVKQIAIEPGRQVVVGGDLVDSQVREIVPQLGQAGAVDIREFNRLPKTQQVTFLYGQGTSIPARMMHEAHEHNKGVLAAQGELRRRQAAVGVSKVVEDHIDASVQKFEVELEQVVDQDNPQAFQPQGFRVDHNAPREQQSNRAARRAARQGRSVGGVKTSGSEA